MWETLSPEIPGVVLYRLRLRHAGIALLAPPDLEGACCAGKAGESDDPAGDDVTNVVDAERDAPGSPRVSVSTSRSVH
jgi:hypothetical protein